MFLDLVMQQRVNCVYTWLGVCVCVGVGVCVCVCVCVCAQALEENNYYNDSLVELIKVVSQRTK